jgi:hypothetical protein
MVALLIGLQGCGSTGNAWPSDVQAEALKGNVASLEQTYYIFLQDRKIPMSGEEKAYNEAGNLLNENRYGRERAFLSKVQYQYPAEGGISATMYTEDNQVYLTMTIGYDAAAKTRTQENKNGQGQVITRVITQHDDQWRGLTETTTSAEGKMLQKIVNTYDAKGNRVKSETLEADGSLETEQIFTYDDQGNAITAKTLDVHTGEYENQFTYQWDDKGNWIQKQTLLNGQVVEQIERKITYR